MEKIHVLQSISTRNIGVWTKIFSYSEQKYVELQ